MECYQAFANATMERIAEEIISEQQKSYRFYEITYQGQN